MGPPDLDRLLENAHWVRALGMELAGAARGEDVAQEAWVAALESRGGVRDPAAWLAGVVRRLAGRARRTDERRTRRERAVARPEAQPPADELLAEAELSRGLIRAVTELDEPFRATVLLRFYRGWTPDEIARSQGVPAATVRTRLHRALAKLRARLDHEHGPAWALAFASPAGLTNTLGGGAILGTKTLVGAAAVLTLTAGALWWGRDERGSDSARVEELVATDGGPPAERQAPPEAPAEAEARERREPAGAASVRTVDEVLLYGAVTDEAGAPVELEQLSLEDARGVVRGASRGTAGSYSLAGLAPGAYRLSATAKGFLTRREELTLRSDQEHQRRDLVLASGLSIPVKVVDETGARWARAEDHRKGDLDLVVTPHEPDGGLSGLERSLGHLYGCGQFLAAGSEETRGLAREHFGLLRLRVAPPVFASLILRDATLETRRIDGPLDELVFTLDRAGLERRLGGIRVRFVDALDGRPLASGQASLDPPSSFSFGGTPLDAAGMARFEGFAPGLYTLRHFDPERAPVNHRVRVPEGSVEDVGDVPVWPRATIRGTILDAAGKPVTASVRWAPLAELRGPADLDQGAYRRVLAGQLELEDVARGPVRLFVEAAEHAPLDCTIDASSGLVQGLVLRLERGQPVVLRVPARWAGRQATLFDAAGLPLDTWTLGAYTLRTRLAPGRYALGLGWAERVEERRELVVGAEGLALDLAEAAR
ncbi:MAG TPA: sigma-70 family RNA polymerase sigma factor [Planctomycetota bacterium]